MKTVRTQTKRILSVLLALLMLATSVHLAFAWESKSDLLKEIDAEMLKDGFAFLAKSDEGLNQGDYWINIEAMQTYGVSNFDSDDLLFYYNPEELALREVHVRFEDEYYDDGYYFGRIDIDNGFNEQLRWRDFIFQVGSDPLEGFTQLAHSKEAMAPGDVVYFDLDEASSSSSEISSRYEDYDWNSFAVYINADGSVLKEKIADNLYGTFYRFWPLDRYIKQLTPPSFDGFTVLSTSADGLSNGAYWIDSSSMETLFNRFIRYYYLSDDGQTLRYAYNFRSYADIDLTVNPQFRKYIHQVSSSDVEPTQPAKDEPPTQKLNFFQRIIEWFRNLFARLFGR